MIDSRQYEWANVDVVLFGRTVVGIRGVKYKELQEKEALHGRGNKPIAIQKGNKTYEGELILMQNEIEAIKLAIGKKSLLDLEFDVTVSYAMPDNDVIVTDQLKGCQFTEKEKGMAQGDQFMEITLPIIALDLKENI